MEVKSKLWMEIDGEPAFGEGRKLLLEAIHRYGSINRAAKKIEIPYRRAWSYIQAMENRLGMKLVERRAGGKNGGGAFLTQEARDFLRKYQAMEEGMKELIDERFREIFGR